MKHYGLWLQRIFYILFALTFLWVLAVSITGYNPFITYSVGGLLIGTLAFVCLTGLIWMLQGRLPLRDPIRTERLLLLICFVVYFALQIYVGWQLRNRYSNSWDFPIMAEDAVLYLESGYKHPDYFSRFPNNMFLYYVYILLFSICRLFGSVNYNLIGIIVGALSVDAAFLLAYLCVRKATGSRRSASFALLGCFSCLPILAYSGIFYSDTMAMPFPILLLYLWLYTKDALRSSEKLRRAALLCVLMATVCTLGSLYKMSCIILLVAAAIDAVCTLPLKRALLGIGIFILVFLVLYSTAYALMESGDPMSENSESGYIPKLHWVMMGLRGIGGYYDQDYEFTLSFPPEERNAAVAEELVERLREMGFKGFYEHLKLKVAYTWGEGTMFTALKLDRNRVAASWLDEYFLWFSPKFPLYAYFCQFHFFTIVLGMIVAAVTGIVRRTKQDLLFPCLLSVFGIFLFLCMWETRSRYLVHFIPVLLCALPSMLSVRCGTRKETTDK